MYDEKVAKRDTERKAKIGYRRDPKGDFIYLLVEIVRALFIPRRRQHFTSS